jgi:hypothetical protein
MRRLFMFEAAGPRRLLFLGASYLRTRVVAHLRLEYPAAAARPRQAPERKRDDRRNVLP